MFVLPTFHVGHSKCRPFRFYEKNTDFIGHPLITYTNTGHEIRTFRASETTYSAVGQPSINLRVSIGQPVKN